MKDEKEVKEVIDYDEMEAIYDYLRGNGSTTASRSSVGLPASLNVKTYTRLVGSNYRSNADPAHFTILTIRLEGLKGSTPANFIHAYLTFIPDNQKLRNPEYKERNGYYNLFITYPISYLATVERMLEHPNAIFCGVGDAGTAPDVNLYAEIKLHVDEPT